MWSVHTFSQQPAPVSHDISQQAGHAAQQAALRLLEASGSAGALRSELLGDLGETVLRSSSSWRENATALKRRANPDKVDLTYIVTLSG